MLQRTSTPAGNNPSAHASQALAAIVTHYIPFLLYVLSMRLHAGFNQAAAWALYERTGNSLNSEKWKVTLIALAATAAVSLGEALLARGMKQTPDGSGLTVLRASVTNGSVLAGTFLMMVYFGLYMWALKLADLSYVLPLTAISYLTGAILAKYLLREDVSAAKWVGTLVITLGVIIVGLGSDSKH